LKVRAKTRLQSTVFRSSRTTSGPAS